MGEQDIVEAIQRLERRMDDSDKERASLIRMVGENTTLTQKVAKNTEDMVSIFQATKKINNGFLIIAKWVATVGAGLAGVIGIYHIFTGLFEK